MLWDFKAADERWASQYLNNASWRRLPGASYGLRPRFPRDTLHASVLELLDALGLAERLLQLRHAKVSGLGLSTSTGTATVELFGSLRANKTVRNAHAWLHKALEVAVRNGYMARNVASKTELLQIPTPNIHTSRRESGQGTTQGRRDHRFRQALTKAGLPRIRFHDLRHTAATQMLADGVPLVTVSNILGHSSPAITVNIYAHALDEAKSQAIAGLSQHLKKED